MNSTQSPRAKTELSVLFPPPPFLRQLFLTCWLGRRFRLFEPRDRRVSLPNQVQFNEFPTGGIHSDCHLKDNQEKWEVSEQRLNTLKLINTNLNSIFTLSFPSFERS